MKLTRSSCLLFPLLVGALLLGGCEEDQSVFERRYVLVKIPGFEAEDYLEFLESADPNLRYLGMANVMAAGGFPPPGSEGEDEETRAIQASVLEKFEDPEAKVRAIAAFAVSPWEDENSEAKLRELLADSNDAIRVEALASLGERPDASPATTDRILEAVDDPNLLVRLHALEALGASTAEESADAVARRLITFLDHKEPYERLVALSALGGVPSEASEARLIEVLREAEDSRTVDVATGALTRWGSSQAEEWVLEAWKADKGSPSTILDFLAEHGTERSQEVLIAELDDENSGNREVCRAILLAQGGEKAIAALEAASISKITSLRESLDSESLSSLGQLIEALSEWKELSQSRPPKAGDVEALLQSKEEHERLYGVWHLIEEGEFDGWFGGIAEPSTPATDLLRALEPLVAAESPFERALAMQALGGSRDSRAGEWLAIGLEDPVYGVRLRALQGVIGRAKLTGDTGELQRLYAKRESFAPTNYGEDDADLEFRVAIEDGVAALTPSWVNRERDLGDLAPGNPPSTRLLAAVRLEEAGSPEGIDALLTFLENGSEGEKNFALGELDPSFYEPEQHSRLERILEGETDPERREILTEMVNALATGEGGG